MTASPIVISYPKMLFSSKILNSVLKEFFASSQLSQFMDQINPLSALIHKRRVSSLGPGGLSRDRVIFSARDIHPSHYGRLCPLETPEGKNAGLVLSLASYARVNSDGFIETPYRYVKNGQIELDKPIVYLTAEEESKFKVLSADVSIDKNNNILDDIVTLKFNDTFIDSPVDETDLIAISTIQPISPATALIPFIEHNDANRALMGSNMQRQAVPLLKPSVPYVGTGLEARLASNSGSLVISYTTGLITRVESNRISILGSDNIEVTYYLQKYQRSNQETCINQKPIVWVGERVKAGQVIADGPGSLNGELALGQNLSLAYTSWEGYNFEDAIIINERLVYQDLFTSIHI
ncbi:MAG: DNA-directed RNA polymerase subunit beta, partial [Cyanobacteria bacterium J06641_2]